MDVLPSLADADIRTLLEKEQLLRFHGEGVSPNLLPDTQISANIARQLSGGDLNLGIEGLFYIKSDAMPSGYTSLPREERTLRLYNILRSVSTLTGLEYYSASRKKMRLLFEESWVIPRLTSPRTSLPDPLVRTVPAQESIFIHQKDRSFATHESIITYLAHEGVLSAAIINQTPLRYKGLIRVVNPGNMQTHLIVIPVEEGLLMYGTISAKTKDVKLFLSRAEASFTNRVIALTGWYRTRLQEEFSEQ